MENQKSFTLIELLIVISMIGFITTIVLVRVQDARERAGIASGLNFSHSLQNAIGVDAVGIWSFDEGVGTLAYDVSGYSNHAVINGAQYTENTPRGAVGTGNGKYALSFEGSDYVEIENLAVNIEKGAYTTVEFWMYWKGENSQMPIGWQQPYSLWLIDGCFGFNTGQNNVLGVSWKGISGRWTHIAAVFYNGKPSVDNVSLYINGVAQNIYECRGTTNASRRVTPKLHISGWAYGSGNQFDGFIDEVRIYSRSLSISQIRKDYVEGLSRHLLVSK